MWFIKISCYVLLSFLILRGKADAITTNKTLNDRAPNIVILYADDLGWSDLKCYGNRFHDTPNLDRLAEQGMKFTRAYAAAPICSASRASLLTGKSPARLNFEFVSTEKHVTDQPLIPPVRTLELPLSEITFAEIAREAGYETAMYGKWHVAKHNSTYLKWSNTHGPLQQGFNTGDDDFGSHPYEKSNLTPQTLTEGTYPLDTSVEKTIRFIRDQQKSEKPFLLFFSSYYVHTPVIPNNSWLVEKYKRVMDGADMDQIKYAAFIETMDYYFGRIIAALEEYGFSENTIILFTSDNGGHPQYTNNLPLRGNKWNLYEGGVREPFIIQWPGRIKAGDVSDIPVIAWDILPTIADVTGISLPPNTDGISLLPLLCGTDSPQTYKRELYWHFPYYHPPIHYEGTCPCSSLLDGDYKLLYFYEEQRTELYNLATDPGETKNLVTEKPLKAEEMRKRLFLELNRVHARFPQKNKNYKESFNESHRTRM